MANLLRYKLIIAIFFCLSAQALARLNIAIGSTPNNLDPYYATDANSQDLNRLLHLSLIDAGRSMQTQCRACVRFEQERLPDGQHRIKFWLRSDLTFIDQRPVTAADVVTSVERLLAQKGAPVPALFSELVSAEVASEGVVQLNFKNYRPENLTNLALLKIERFEGDKRIPAGEFSLERQSELALVLKRRNGEILEFKVVADETTMALKLLNGEVDVIATGMSPRKTQWLAQQNKLKNFSVEGTNYVYISPQHRHPDLKHRSVRRALSHLIPRKDLAEYKQKKTVALAEGMFSSAFEDLHLGLGPIEYDPKKAHTLLQQAGYERRADGWWKDGRKLSFVLKVSNKKHIIELARALVPYWQRENIELKVQAAEWGTFYRDLKSGNFDLALGQWVGFVGADQMGFTFLRDSIPPGGANRGFYHDEVFEDHYKRALESAQLKEQAHHYRQAYRRLIDTEAYISLWHPKIIWVARDCVKKIDLYPTGNFLAFESLEHSCQH